MNEHPRVFHLITRLLKGGAEGKTIGTVLGLEDYEFTVGYGSEYHPDQVRLLNEHGVRTQRFRTIRHYNPMTAVPAVLTVAQYISAQDFDIIHTHSTEAGIIGRFAAQIVGGLSVVHTVHGVPFADDRNPLLERFILGCERWAAPMTDCIVTNADSITMEYLRYGIGEPEQYKTVYSGIKLDRFRDVEPAEDIGDDGISIVMISRLADGKGCYDLLEAIEALSDVEISVYFVGDGPERGALEKAVRSKGLDKTVSLLGFRSDVPAILAASDVFVLPSYREGTPRVITEAMASELPVVATDIAGIPEQVSDGKSGYLIQPGDVEALADRLDNLIGSRALREKFGKCGRERVGRFSVEGMQADLDEVYQTLLG